MRINKDNYHIFDNMVYWRIHGEERDKKDKLKVEVTSEIQEELSNSNLYIYSAMTNGKLVGWISLIYMPKVERYEPLGNIFRLCVERNFYKEIMI